MIVVVITIAGIAIACLYLGSQPRVAPSPHTFVPDPDHPAWCALCGRREEAHSPERAA